MRAKARAGREGNQLFTLDVTIVSGPMTEKFSQHNPQVSRTIEIRGDRTLADLHEVFFHAFDREDEHMYEFQVGGKRPMDQRARRYVLPMAMDDPLGESKPAGDVSSTSVGSLGLETGDTFGYWFDFGDDWWHEVEVVAVDEDPHPLRKRPKLPKITKRVGQSPPQYVDWDEEE